MSAPAICYLDEVLNRTPKANELFVFSDGSRISSGDFVVASKNIAAQINRFVTRRSGLICIGGYKKSNDAVQAIFGTLFAEYGFLFFDSRWPSERIADILSKIDPDAVIYCDAARSHVPTAPHVAILTIESGAVTCENKSASESALFYRDPSSLAYAIYTSGSTGRSKLVGIPHSSVSNFLRAFDARLALSDDSRWLSLSPLSFDMSIVDLFYPALKGATNILLDGVFSISQLVDAIDKRAITHLSAVTSVVELLAHYIDRLDKSKLKTLRAIHFGGERFDINSAKKLLAHLPGTTLFFGYGAAEASPASLMNVFSVVPDTWQSVPAGTPFPGIKVDLFNATSDHGQMRGELVIGGPVLMAGYIGDAQRSETVLREFEFRQEIEGGSSKGYFTGDIFSRDADGTYWFEGRSDDLVKRNGFLVSLTQIEEAVKRLNPAEYVVAQILGRGLSSRLVVVVLNPSSEDPSLKSRLSEILPIYMLPDSISFIHRGLLPRLESGKIDRRFVVEELADIVPQTGVTQ